MLDFIRKSFLWNAWDQNLQNELPKLGGFHLKSIQDLAVYSHLKSMQGKTIGEIGGGNSRVLRTLSKNNTCYNIEKFAGKDGGPASEVIIPNVENILVFLGEFSPLIKDESFDCLFSVSVVEHVPSQNLEDFAKDGLRALKSGGLWIHAIDMYLKDEPEADTDARYQAYRNWFNLPGMKALGPIFDGPIEFRCDMATNPDDTMHAWGRIAPNLIPLRQIAQSTSLLLIGQKA